MARVMIIEDSQSQAAVICEIVRDAGHEPILCEDFTKSIAQTVRKVNPDLVLLDLVLLGPDGRPVADGFTICREIKRVSQHAIGVIVLSAKGDEESAEWAILQGADAFLQKPFAVPDLIKVIGKFLDKRGATNVPGSN